MHNVSMLYLKAANPPQLWCKFLYNDTHWDFPVKHAKQTGDNMVEIIGYVAGEGRDVSVTFRAEKLEPYKNHIHVVS